MRSSIASQKNDSIGNIAWRSLAAAYRTVKFRVNSDLRRYGLTSPQYEVLRTLGASKAKSLPMNEISREMLVTFADITTIVDNLEKQNYVKRVRGGEDRRVIRVELTAEGLVLFDKILVAHRRQISKLMRGLSRSELENLIAYTTRIRESVSASNSGMIERRKPATSAPAAR
jgi:MarR family 2-MHQ and catechol resistance regulon transcriptional repressor